MLFLDWLTPWEFSPTLVVAFIVGGWLFVRGTRVHRVGKIRQVMFWIGLAFLYLSLHTRVDYYAERMFFIHRVQHLVLHLLGGSGAKTTGLETTAVRGNRVGL
jgi:putative membrane protein